jgi:predicted transcriptional regulator
LARAPEERAEQLEKRQSKIRRKFKVTPKKQQKFLPHEAEFKKEMAVILKLAGYSNRQIGDTIGVTRGTVGEWLKEGKTQAKIEKLMEALPLAAKSLLQGFTIEAVHSIAAVMRDSDDDKFVLEAAKEILDRGGLPKASRQEIDSSSTKKTQFSVDEENLAALRELPPHLQEEAAQAMEELQNTLTQIASRANEGEDV